MSLHVFRNPLGEAVVAESLEEAIRMAKQRREAKGKKTTGPALKYVRVPDTEQITGFATYSQRFIRMKARDWAKKLGKGVPHADE